MAIENYDKKVKKTTCGFKIYSKFLEEFESMRGRAAGGKGEQISAGIMAFMAIHRIDKGLASALTDPELDSEQAADLIIKSMTDVIYRRAVENLTPKQRAQLLEDAKQSRRKLYDSPSEG